MRIAEVETGRARVSTLIAGPGGDQVICLHGLGWNKASLFETVAALAGACTVHALDLPGFGASAKPARAPYNAAWFAEAGARIPRRAGLDRAHLVGNSMGGRIALEAASPGPRSGPSLSLLAPALAFRRRRELAPLVRLLRPELAAIPHQLARAPGPKPSSGICSRDPERLDPAAADVAVEEFCRVYRSRAARVAFFAAARNIYLDGPNGDEGFYAEAGAARAARDVRLGRRRHARPFRLRSPRRRDPAGGAPGRARGLRARAPVELPETANRLIGEQIAAEANRRGRAPRLRRGAAAGRLSRRRALAIAARRISGRARL